MSGSVKLPPYAAMMGIGVDHWDEDMPVLAMEYRGDLCGNPGKFHGGALGGLLELAAFAGGEAHLAKRGGEEHMRSLGITISYLRMAGAHRLYARATPLRTGRRLINIQVQAWQEDRAKPVATAFVNIALKRPSD